MILPRRDFHLTGAEYLAIIISVIRVWRSLVSRLVRVQETVGSNPATRTNVGAKFSVLRRFCIVWENHAAIAWFSHT